jgi:hypothetical protein
MDLDTENVRGQLLDLDDALDAVDGSLLPLKLTGDYPALDSKTSKLDHYLKEGDIAPLDRAKLLVTLSYAIDSLLFCLLKVQGTETESHVIMRELERIKQYVGKIKAAASKGQASRSAVDKEAAGRMVGHALSGNAAHDRDRALRVARQNGRLKEALATAAASAGQDDASITVGKHTRFANSQLAQVQQDDAADSQASSTAGEDTLEVHDDEEESSKAKARRERRAAKKDRMRKQKEKQIKRDA